MNPPRCQSAYVTTCPLKRTLFQLRANPFRRRNECFKRIPFCTVWLRHHKNPIEKCRFYCVSDQKSLAFWWNNYIFTRLKTFFYLSIFYSWDLLYEEPEISTPTKGWFLSTRRSSGPLISWIKLKNRNIITPNDIGSLFRSNFLVREDIEGSKP